MKMYLVLGFMFLIIAIANLLTTRDYGEVSQYAILSALCFRASREDN